MRRRIAATASGVVLLIAIGAGVVQAADRNVTISGFRFSPATVTVNVGDTVTWTNRDGQAHTATSGTAWSTGDIGGGRSKSITFRTPGTFDYICAIHPTMTGLLVVRAGTAPATDTALASGATDQDSRGVLVILGLASVGGALIGAHRFRPATGRPRRSA
jgi:plastocyanin